MPIDSRMNDDGAAAAAATFSSRIVVRFASTLSWIVVVAVAFIIHRLQHQHQQRTTNIAGAIHTAYRNGIEQRHSAKLKRNRISQKQKSKIILAQNIIQCTCSLLLWWFFLYFSLSRFFHSAVFIIVLVFRGSWTFVSCVIIQIRQFQTWTNVMWVYMCAWACVWVRLPWTLAWYRSEHMSIQRSCVY